MIRRDYLLRMIEEFIQALSRIKALKSGASREEASIALDAEFQRLVGTGARAVSELSETELQARLLRGESTQIIREKTLILTALLKEAGDLAANSNAAESRNAYLKGLDLLLESLARGEPAELPEFVPRVEVFLAALADESLPLETQVRLMQHFERLGEFARAEDALFAMLEAEPARPGLVEFGLGFYERLAGQSDDALAAGNLPRAELTAGLAELRQRQT